MWHMSHLLSSHYSTHSQLNLRQSALHPEGNDVSIVWFISIAHSWMEFLDGALQYWRWLPHVDGVVMADGIELRNVKHESIPNGLNP